MSFISLLTEGICTVCAPQIRTSCTGMLMSKQVVPGMPSSTAQPFSQCSSTEKPEHKHRLISETTQQPKGHLGVLLADFRHIEDGRLHVDQHILETLWATGNLHDPKGRGPRCFKRLRGWSCLVRPWSGSDPKFQGVISASDPSLAAHNRAVPNKGHS